MIVVRNSYLDLILWTFLVTLKVTLKGHVTKHLRIEGDTPYYFKLFS